MPNKSINVGTTYQVIVNEGDDCVIHVHRIVKRAEKTILIVSNYVFQKSLFSNCNDVIDNDRGMLFLLYTDWEHCGEEQDAVELPLSQVRDVVRTCQIEFPQDGPEGLCSQDAQATSTNSQAILTFLVEWGISRSIIPSLFQSPIEVRNMRHRGDQLELNSQDIEILKTSFTVHDHNCGMGGSTVGFTEAGFNVTIGTELNAFAASLWKVLFQNFLTNYEQKNHNSTIYHEDTDEFLDKFLDRTANEDVTVPAVLLMSSPYTGTFLNASAEGVAPRAPADCPHDSDCDVQTKVVRAAKIINPPVLVSQHPTCLFDKRSIHSECLQLLFMGLISAGYEFRATIFQASDFGILRPQRRFILVASKVGLPSLPCNSLCV